MSDREALLGRVDQTLRTFTPKSLKASATLLLNTLGYDSERSIELEPNTFTGFQQAFGGQGTNFKPENALADEWLKAEIIFQLTDEDFGNAKNLFDDNAFQHDRYNSLLFMAVVLRGDGYTRTQLARITREINKCFLMPVIVLYTYAGKLTLAVIERREHKRESDKDVLEKVMLVKDIDTAEPHRAHLEILGDLALDELARKKAHRITNFKTLFAAWQDTLDIQTLNEKFYRELASWFFWAEKHPAIKFAHDVKDAKERQSALIRLVTRLIFMWFLVEKDLIPDALFDRDKLKGLLNDFDPVSDDSSYYQAILQNLFFATLNTPMRRDDESSRHFAKTGDYRVNRSEYMTDLYRYEDAFTDPERALELFDDIPFLNGGLFERLDRPAEAGMPERRLDGFSRDKSKRMFVPNELFFGRDRSVTLDFEGKSKRYRIRGLIELLKGYKFTVSENTPIEQEVALDPELLGKVFENLLAAYNPETETTARKQTGSFYTPREVVDFMVDESLVAYLHTQLSQGEPVKVPGQDAQAHLLYANDPNSLLSPVGEADADDPLEQKLRDLLTYSDQEPEFNETQKARLVEAIDKAQILDPACGSGAFPMGALQKLVYVLGKLDPDNQLWLARQSEREIGAEVARLKQDTATAQGISEDAVRQQAISGLNTRLEEIEDAFNERYADPDYARKLFLIENCIYGVDIQPIAMQIAKLRFFISLVIEQKVDPQAENLGIKPLPNLETKFVAADTLIPLASQQVMKPQEVYALETELEQTRRQHFLARTWREKKRLRELDKKIRGDIVTNLQKVGFKKEDATMLADWNPYDQNAKASFFDPAWMFGLDEGFDIVIGNPPYVRQEQIKHYKARFKPLYKCYSGTADLFVYFFERGIQVLKPYGILSYICSNKYFRSGYGEALRRYLSTRTSIELLIDFGDAPVFTAIAYPSILVTQKARPHDQQIRAMNWEPGPPIESFREIFEDESFTVPQASLTADGWSLEPEKVRELLKKLRERGTPLGEYVGGRFYYGIKTGYNEAFVVDRETCDQLIEEHESSAEVLKPFLRGRDVKRWKVGHQDLWLLFIPWHFPLHDNVSISGVSVEAEKAFQERYPAVYKHLLKFKPKLEARNKAETGIRYEWYALQRCAATYWREFDQPKIIIPAITSHTEYAFDGEQHFSNDKTSICVSDNPKFLLALLNSNLLWWFIQQIAASRQGGFFEFKPMYVTQLPIVQANNASENLLIRLVDYILTVKHQDLSTSKDQLMLRFFEQLIDAVVYELYLPDELHKAERYPTKLLQAENLPELSGDVSADLEMLGALYGRLAAAGYPVRNLLDGLAGLEVVRLIEGD